MSRENVQALVGGLTIFFIVTIICLAILWPRHSLVPAAIGSVVVPSGYRAILVPDSLIGTVFIHHKGKWVKVVGK